MKNVNLYTICTSGKNYPIKLEAKDYNIEEWKDKILNEEKGELVKTLYKGVNNTYFNKIYNLLNSRYEKVNHYIISAGGGIVSRNSKLVPYNCGFSIESGENKVDKKWFDYMNDHIFNEKDINIFIISTPYLNIIKNLIPPNSIVISSKGSKKIYNNIVIYDNRAREIVKSGDSFIISKYSYYLLSKVKNLNTEDLQRVSDNILKDIQLPIVKKRKKLTDEEILELITIYGITTKTRLLKVFRDNNIQIGTSRLSRLIKKTDKKVDYK